MRTEKAIGIIVLLAIVLKFSHIPGSSILLVFSLYLLTAIYFAGAFYFFSDKSIKRQNLPLSIGSGIALSVVPMAVLFRLQYWSGNSTLLLTAVLTAAIVLGLVIYMRKKSTEDLQTYYKNMYTRALVLFLASAIFLAIPMSTLISLQYRYDPEMARLKIQHYSEPRNLEFKRQHDQYMRQHENTLYQKPEGEK